MTSNERVRAVYQGRTPDRVPLILDLSHGYKRNMNTGFNLAGYTQVEQGLVDLHKQVGDALTPAPMFSQTPEQMRDQAGPDLILSGGIPPTIFGPGASDQQFDDCVKRWLDTRLASPRLIMAAGDQVPIEAPFERIARLPELVDGYGKYCGRVPPGRTHAMSGLRTTAAGGQGCDKSGGRVNVNTLTGGSVK